MRILVTNDDGIDAPGLALLERIAQRIGTDVWCFAPENERSGASRSFTSEAPVRIRTAGPQRFAITGTPADCVMLALKEVMKDAMPDLVLSGVNYGSNIGEEVGYSGTLSAAMEGTLSGIRSIGLSQLYDPETRIAPWHVAEAHAEALVRALLKVDWPARVLLAVNFPALQKSSDWRGIQATRQGQGNVSGGQYLNEKRLDRNGRPYYWTGFKTLVHSEEVGTDVWAISHGYASVTPLQLDMTDYRVLGHLGEHLGIALG